jgi:hypothetical protein
MRGESQYYHEPAGYRYADDDQYWRRERQGSAP